ncbi:MAG: hypothetical protein ACAH88_10555, partial [Roseimicrobium sp.]
MTDTERQPWEDSKKVPSCQPKPALNAGIHHDMIYHNAIGMPQMLDAWPLPFPLKTVKGFRRSLSQKSLSDVFLCLPVEHRLLFAVAHLQVAVV